MPNPNKAYSIVVGVDYSETGELAFTRALEIAAQHSRAELHVVHVLTSDLAFASELEFSSSSALETAGQRLADYVDKKILAFRAAAPRDAALDHLRVVPHLRAAVPAYEVAQVAANLEADLVVVGTHGRRALARMVLGSVAELTVRLSPCPVLVVRPKASPARIPSIEPPCPRCLDERVASGGRELWCEQHRERHGQRHTYHQGDGAGAETNMPLVMRS